MIVNQTNFDEGVRLGTTRANPHFPTVSLDVSSRTKIRNALDKWPGDLHGRFVELFVEMATLASIARSHYTEPPLTEDELYAFLVVLLYFSIVSNIDEPK
jgi:hypothetical protein